MLAATWHPGVWFALGLALGLAAGSLGWLWYVERAVRRVRAAERRARAAERMADLGAMTGGLAHEIKNPLSTIGLNAQLISEAAGEIEPDAPTDPDVKARLIRRSDSLRREAERLKGILQDFLEYAGTLKLDRKSVDLNELVHELADFFMPQAEQAGVRLRVDTAPGKVPAFVDPAAIKQSLLNLLLNAVQAFPPPGTSNDPRELIVRTARQIDRERTPSATIHVIDTGPGIKPELIASIFKPYVTTKPGGSGLGLSTTKRLIEAHGGKIDVHSEPGRGSQFTVTLPGE
ncbi:MAG: two-component sensor histidine kinase [Tepidisphaera sp.]|jgi:signal transduction histidine kinase